MTDPFEQDLRAVLQVRAGGSLPPHLAATILDPRRRPAAAPRGPNVRRWAIACLGIAASVLLVAVATAPLHLLQTVAPAGVATVSPRPSSTQQAVIVSTPDPEMTPRPGASADRSSIDPFATSAPAASADPADQRFVWDNGQVRLTADALIITIDGRTFQGPGLMGGSLDPHAGVLWQQRLHATWFGPAFTQLQLDFQRDADHWWLVQGEIAVRGEGSAQFTSDRLRAPVGTALTGDVVLQGDLVRFDANGKHQTDLPVTLRFANLSLEPFGGAVARTMTDCRPVVDPGSADVSTSPLERGQPLAGKGLVGMSSGDAAAAVARLGYCYLFDRRLSTAPSLGPTGILETWCDTPAGAVAGLRYGSGGELHLIVIDAVQPGATPRPQPLRGWGCDPDAVGSPPPFPDPAALASPRPAASLPPVAPMTPKSVVWDTGQVRLAADEVLVHVGDRTFVAPADLTPEEFDPDQPDLLRVDWGRGAQRISLRLWFSRGDGSWWVNVVDLDVADVTNVATLYNQPTRTPLWTQQTGDVTIPAGTLRDASGLHPVTIELRGAELQPYRDLLPRTMRDCQPVKALHPDASINPAAPGQPIDGLTPVGRPTADVAAEMQQLGYCYRFELDVPASDGHTVIAETWCDAPPGTIRRATYGESGEVVFLVDNTDATLIGRAQPPVGWGCLSDVPGYAASPTP